MGILHRTCKYNKADLWINIPHMADKDYIRSLAKLIKNQLNPELNVYVE